MLPHTQPATPATPATPSAHQTINHSAFPVTGFATAHFGQKPGASLVHQPLSGVQVLEGSPRKQVPSYQPMAGNQQAENNRDRGCFGRCTQWLFSQKQDDRHNRVGFSFSRPWWLHAGDGVYIKGIHLRWIAVVVWTLVFAWIMRPYVARITSDPLLFELISLQPSQTIHADQIADYTRVHRPQLLEYMQQEKDAIGVCAALRRSYYQYLVLHTNGTFIGMFNPNIWPLTHLSRLVQTVEISLLCKDQGVASEMTHIRHTHIQLNYTSEDGRVSQATLRDNDAFVMQHLMDVMSGKWMCNDNGKQSRIPANMVHVRETPHLPKTEL